MPDDIGKLLDDAPSGLTRPEGLIYYLEKRFQEPLPPPAAARIRATRDDQQLKQWANLSFHVASLEALARKMQAGEKSYAHCYPWSEEGFSYIFDLIDRMMVLPDEEERQLIKEMIAYEEEIGMPYLTNVDRLARQEGRATLLLRVLQRRLKPVLPAELVVRIQNTKDVDLLQRWFDRALEVASLDELRQEMQV
jgi:hypothetical protein